MFWNRVHCHFCGTRSPHSKSSGITEYQCASCEAFNFLDEKGNIIDTPATIAAQGFQSNTQPAAFHTFTKPLPETLNHQKSRSFCNTCLHNQRVYMEVLGNYLPDDDHPRYQEYEDALPKFKEDLAQKYPQICAKCAPKAQIQLNRADYYASSERIAHTLKESKIRGRASLKGRRDDWTKRTMRLVLLMVGLVAYGSLLTQGLWHIMSIFAPSNIFVMDDADIGNFVFEPTVKECTRQALRLCIEPSCSRLLSTYVSRALLLSTGLLWYNPGLKYWFDGTYRMEAVTGQTEYLRMQIVMLAIRTIAWYNLTNAQITLEMTRSQLAAAHGFMIIFLGLTQWVCNRQIGHVKFSANTKITPMPSERDVLGAVAGLACDYQTGQASSIPPTHLLARNRYAPFPIANLAVKQPNMSNRIPSPPDSQEEDEGGMDDSMAMDWEPAEKPTKPVLNSISRVTRSQSRGQANGLSSSQIHSTMPNAGWTGMRSELFGIDDSLSAQNRRQQEEESQRAKLSYEPPAQLNPFRGRLPQAPMSMERRLRNPVSQVQPFKMTPLSKQQDFMKQMRNGIQQGKAFQPSKPKTQDPFGRLALDDGDDEDFSPAKTRTRGDLELRQSGWQLASDVAQATGLEDLFGGNNFRLDDEPKVVKTAAAARQQKQRAEMMLTATAVVMVLAGLLVAWSIQPVRRAVCLWLVARLDALEI